MQTHLEQLVGKTVCEVRRDADEDLGEVYALVFKDGTVATILRDPEGNGPGHLDITPV